MELNFFRRACVHQVFNTFKEFLQTKSVSHPRESLRTDGLGTHQKFAKRPSYNHFNVCIQARVVLILGVFDPLVKHMELVGAQFVVKMMHVFWVPCHKKRLSLLHWIIAAYQYT